MAVVHVCLFCLKRLSHDCEDHIRDQIEDAAMDYRQDAHLVQACKDEVCCRGWWGRARGVRPVGREVGWMQVALKVHYGKETAWIHCAKW